MDTGGHHSHRNKKTGLDFRVRDKSNVSERPTEIKPNISTSVHPSVAQSGFNRPKSQTHQLTEETAKMSKCDSVRPNKM